MFKKYHLFRTHTGNVFSNPLSAVGTGVTCGLTALLRVQFHCRFGRRASPTRRVMGAQGQLFARRELAHVGRRVCMLQPPRREEACRGGGGRAGGTGRAAWASQVADLSFRSQERGAASRAPRTATGKVRKPNVWSVWPVPHCVTWPHGRSSSSSCLK